MDEVQKWFVFSQIIVQSCGPKNTLLFSLEVHLEELCSPKNILLWLGGFVGQDFNL